MKKRIVAILIGISVSVSASAQVNPHAIGLRGGYGNYGGGGEVTYQHGFGSSNRLELDLGWRGNNGINGFRHTALSGIYHWVWNLDGGLNWYIGPGAQLGFYDSKFNNSNDDGMTLDIGGQIGLEFDFNELGAPILLSLDSRPMWGFIGGTSGFGYGAAFSLRYTF